MRTPGTVLALVLAGGLLAGCGNEGGDDFDSGGTGGSTSAGSLAVGEEIGGSDSSTSPLAAGTLQFAEGDTALVGTCGAQTCRWATEGGPGVAVGAGGDLLAYAAGVALEPAGGEVLVVDVVAREVTAALSGHGSGGADTLPAIRAVGLSLDGRTAVTAGEDGTVRVWDTGDGSQAAELDLADVLASGPVLDPSGARVALTWEETTGEGDPAGDPSRSSGVFDTATGELVGEPDGLARSHAWSPDGSYVVGTDTAGELATFSETDWVRTDGSGVRSNGPVAISPDGTTIVFVEVDDPAVIRLWRPQTEEPVTTIRTDHPDPVVALAWSEDGSLLATGSSQVLDEDERPPEDTRDEVQVREVGAGPGDAVRLTLPGAR